MEFEKEDHSAIAATLTSMAATGVLVIAFAYAGTLWTKANTKESALAQCEEMLPNAVVDCPLAAQVAECNVKYPWATCETSRSVK
jgi:hypothetical protein